MGMTVQLHKSEPEALEEPVPQLLRSDVVVLVPAYNEGLWLADTILSLQSQSMPPDEIIVIDDCSTDDTAEIGKALGVTVLRSLKHLGSKAAAQNYALPFVKSRYVVAVDADTVLEKHALERLVSAIRKTGAMACCGWVLPKQTASVWEKGRFVEYMFAFAWYKQIQNAYEHPLICSGCFNIYQTEKLKALGGYPTSTVTEDLDLTWRIYEENAGRVVFVPDALCCPSEPNTIQSICRQLKRWSFGFQENMRDHFSKLIRVEKFRIFAMCSWIEGTVAALYYLIGVPIIYYFLGWIPVVALFITDWIVMGIPSVIGARRFKLVRRTLLYLPSYYVLRMVNSFYFLYAFFSVWLFNKRLKVYEKGH